MAGELTKSVNESNESIRREQSGEVHFEAVLDRAMPSIMKVMPDIIDSDRFRQIALACYKQDSDLARCSVQSILSCLLKCSALGLEPSEVDGLGRAYLIPFKGQATFILGYRGMIELMRRSGQLRKLSVHAVHEGDEFSYELGSNEYVRHVPHYRKGAKLTHVYLFAELKSGETYINVMSKDEVDEHRARSKASGSGPWVTDYESMALKTVVRASAKWLPMTPQAAEAVGADGTTPVYADVEVLDGTTGEVA